VGVRVGSSWSLSHFSSMGLMRTCSLFELSSFALLTHLSFPSLYCKLVSGDFRGPVLVSTLACKLKQDSLRERQVSSMP
jgi:hypothetical protein